MNDHILFTLIVILEIYQKILRNFAIFFLAAMKWILNCFCDKNPSLTLTDVQSRPNVKCKLYFND